MPDVEEEKKDEEMQASEAGRVPPKGKKERSKRSQEELQRVLPGWRM